MTHLSSDRTLNDLQELLGRLEEHHGSLVISKNAEIWTAAVTTTDEDMTVGGFETGTDLSEVLYSIIEQLEEQ